MPITQFSPDTLRSNITDFAKGNRYNVEIIPPTAVGLDLGVASQLRYICESASLPTRSLASQPQDIHGPPREIPDRATFTEAAMSFYLDDEMKVKNFFDSWQEYIINENTGSPRYWNDYTSDINISRIGNNAEAFTDVSYKVTLQEAYPSIVGEIALTHSGGNEVLRLPVTFKFKKWISIL